MTEEKFCPIISTVTMIPCQKEKCRAYRPPHDIDLKWPIGVTPIDEHCSLEVF